MADVEETYVRFPAPPDFTKQITVVVGDEQQPDLSTTFVVHEQPLLDKLAFFRAACRNEWKEATTRTVKLPKMDVATFQLYLVWVYKERLDVTIKEGFEKCVPTDHCREALTSLAKLWVAGDQLQDLKLRNEVTDAMINVIGSDWDPADATKVFPAELTSFIWQNTRYSTVLRELTLDFHMSTFAYHDIQKTFYEYDSEFVKDLLADLLSLQRTKQPSRTPDSAQSEYRCKYHDHDDENPKSECPQRSLHQ